MSYYAITIFTEWGLPPTSVAILFQVIIVCNSNPYEAGLVFFWQACNFSDGFYADPFSYGFAGQATITVGYLLSPLVMRRVDTRPQVRVIFEL